MTLFTEKKRLDLQEILLSKISSIKFFLLILFELPFDTIKTENIVRRKRHASRTNKHARKSRTH